MNKLDQLLKDLCPQGVEYKTIGEVATYRRGSFPQPYTNSAFYGGDDSMPFVQVADIEDEGFRLKKETKQTISKLAQPKSIFVPKGSVICSIQGTIGRVAITQYDSYVDRTIAIFDGFKVDINKKFFAYCIQIKFGIEKEYARGSTLKTITKEEFTKFKIPIPPMQIQEEIVLLLDKINDISSKILQNLSQEIEKRKSEYNYYFEKMIYNENMIETSVGDVCDTITDYVAAGSFGDISKNVKYLDFPDYAQLIRTVDIKNKFKKSDYIYVNENAFNYLWRVNLDKESIILPNIGVNCGEVYYVTPDDLIYERNVLGPNAILVRSSTDNNKLLSYVFMSNSFQKRLRKIISPAGQTKFNKTELKKLKINIPKDIKEQEKIANLLEKLSTAYEKYINNLNKEIEYRKNQFDYYKYKLLFFKEVEVNE